MKKLVVLGVGSALAAIACVAGAQGSPTGMSFAGAKQVIVSADRMFGVHFWSQKADQQAAQLAPGITTQAQTQTVSGTGVNLLWGGSGDINGPSAIPRLGVDVGLGYGITVGGALGYMHRSSSTKTTQGGASTEVDNPSTSTWAFAPRGGFAFPLSDPCLPSGDAPGSRTTRFRRAKSVSPATRCRSWIPVPTASSSTSSPCW